MQNDEHTTHIPVEEMEAFLKWLDEPPEVIETLKSLYEKYKNSFQNSSDTLTPEEKEWWMGMRPEVTE